MKYRVQWLRARDAADVARLERAVHPAAQRSGLDEIEEDLREADLEGSNLSLGLYLGRRMVGYLLVFLERDRNSIPGYLGIDKPDELDLSGTGVFIFDYGVLREHRRAAGMLLERLFSMALFRGNLVGLPADIVCIEPLMHYWESRSRVAARFGYGIATKHRFQGPQPGQPMYWLTFERERVVTWESRSTTLAAALKETSSQNDNGNLSVGVLRSATDWALLEPSWGELLRVTPGVTVFQTSEYLRSWWANIGWPWELQIIVAMRGEQVVGIAPMYCAPSRLWGKELRCLTFLGQPSEADRPTVFADPADVAVTEAIASYITDTRELWDCLVLYEQHRDSPFYQAILGRLRQAGAITSQIEVPVCAFVTIQGTWESYLASRSKAFRKNIRRRMAQLEQRGTVTFDVSCSPASAEAAMDTYLCVERSSWKIGSAIGVSQSSAHQAFYRDLAQRLPADAQMQFKILRLNGKPIAATFGILWQRCFYSLHIAHDEAYAELSPGVVLTAYELRDAFGKREYDKLDFLGGFLTNKLSWSTGGVSTVALYADRDSPRARIYHFITFKVRPRLRLLLIRLHLLKPAQRLKRFIHERRSRDE